MLNSKHINLLREMLTEFKYQNTGLENIIRAMSKVNPDRPSLIEDLSVDLSDIALSYEQYKKSLSAYNSCKDMAIQKMELLYNDRDDINAEMELEDLLDSFMEEARSIAIEEDCVVSMLYTDYKISPYISNSEFMAVVSKLRTNPSKTMDLYSWVDPDNINGTLPDSAPGFRMGKGEKARSCFYEALTRKFSLQTNESSSQDEFVERDYYRFRLVSEYNRLKVVDSLVASACTKLNLKEGEPNHNRIYKIIIQESKGLIDLMYDKQVFNLYKEEYMDGYSKRIRDWQVPF